MSDLFEPWFLYKHPCVRQLAFCLASPNIIHCLPDDLSIKFSFKLHHNSFWVEQYENYKRRLIELDENPAPLITFLNQLKSTRLGFRFEKLIWFWLLDETYHSFRLIGHSIQKFDKKQTIGELDFIILNQKTKEIEHWEVAIKFYLGEDDFHINRWYGLNKQDTLARKLTHFTEKQFQFSQIDQHQIHQKYAVLKGQLYFPYNTSSNLPVYPNWVNLERCHGYWGDTPLPNLYKLSRQEWFTPNYSTDHKPSTHWWNDGLYCDSEQQFFYMFRQKEWQKGYTAEFIFKHNLKFNLLNLKTI